MLSTLGGSVFRNLGMAEYKNELYEYGFSLDADDIHKYFRKNIKTI